MAETAQRLNDHHAHTTGGHVNNSPNENTELMMVERQAAEWRNQVKEAEAKYLINKGVHDLDGVAELAVKICMAEKFISEQRVKMCCFESAQL